MACRYCKGSGQILLLNSRVSCDCAFAKNRPLANAGTVGALPDKETLKVKLAKGGNLCDKCGELRMAGNHDLCFKQRRKEYNDVMQVFKSAKVMLEKKGSICVETVYGSYHYLLGYRFFLRTSLRLLDPKVAVDAKMITNVHERIHVWFCKDEHNGITQGYHDKTTTKSLLQVVLPHDYRDWLIRHGCVQVYKCREELKGKKDHYMFICEPSPLEFQCLVVGVDEEL